jgi:outer membrane autotransporter protein
VAIDPGGGRRSVPFAGHCLQRWSMSKLRTTVLAAVAALVAAPALAHEQDPDTTNQASLQSLGPVLAREMAPKVSERLAGRVDGVLADTILVEQGVNPDHMTTYAGTSRTTGLSAGEQQTGMSAGAAPGRLGVWVSGGWTALEDGLSSTAYDGNAYNVLIGADYQFNDRFLMGLATGYESSNIDTHFNTGNLTSDGWTVSPYAGFVLNRYFTLDLSGGYTKTTYDMRRTAPLAAGSNTIPGGTDGDRWFLAGNLNGYYAIDRLLLNGRVGYIHSNESQDAYTEAGQPFENPERDINLGQFRVGGQVGYDLGMLQPYVTGTWVYDVTRKKVFVAPSQAQPANDRSGFDVGGGIRFAISDRVSGGIQGTTHLGRDNFDSHSVSGNLRVRF